MAEYALDIIGKIADFQQKIGSIPGMTDEAAAKAALALERRLSAAQRKAAAEAEKAAKKAAAAWGEAGGAFKKLAGGIGLGPIANDIDDIIGGLGMLGGGAGLAAGAVAGIGIAGGVAAAGVYKIVSSADEAMARLGKLSGIEPISQTTQHRITDANKALEGIGVVADMATVALGSNLAPAVERVAAVAIELGLRGIDMFNAWSTGKSVLEEFGVWIASTFVQQLLWPVTGLVKLIEVMGEVGEAFGVENNALTKLGERYDEWTEGIARSVIGTVASSDALQLNTDRADALLGSLGTLTTTTDKATESAKTHASGARDEADAMREAAEAAKAERSAIEMLYSLQAEAAADLLSAEEKLAAAYEEKSIAARNAGADEATTTATLAELQARYFRDLNALNAKRAADATATADLVIAEHQRANAEAVRFIEEEKEARLQANADAITAAEGFGDAALSIINTIDEREASLRQDKIDGLKREIDGNEKLTASERKAIRAQIALQRDALKQVAVREKAVAIFQATLSAAAGIAKAVAAAPPRSTSQSSRPRPRWQRPRSRPPCLPRCRSSTAVRRASATTRSTPRSARARQSSRRARPTGWAAPVASPPRTGEGATTAPSASRSRSAAPTPTSSSSTSSPATPATSPDRSRSWSPGSSAARSALPRPTPDDHPLHAPGPGKRRLLFLLAAQLGPGASGLGAPPWVAASSRQPPSWASRSRTPGSIATRSRPPAATRRRVLTRGAPSRPTRSRSCRSNSAASSPTSTSRH